MSKKVFVVIIFVFSLVSFVNADTVYNVNMTDSLSKKTCKLSTCNLRLNDVPLNTDVPAVIYKSRTLVPIRVVAESLGCEVKWNNANRQVTIEKGKTKISFVIDDPDVIVSGKVKRFPDDVPAKLFTYQNSTRTLVPVRFISEELGAKVGWESKGHIVKINKDGIGSVVVVEKKIKKPKAKPLLQGDINSVLFNNSGSIKEIRLQFPQTHKAYVKATKKDLDKYRPLRLIFDVHNSNIREDLVKNVNSNGIFVHDLDSNIVSKLKISKISENLSRVYVEIKTTKQNKKNIDYKILKTANSISIFIGRKNNIKAGNAEMQKRAVGSKIGSEMMSVSKRKSKFCLDYEVIKTNQFAVLKYKPEITRPIAIYSTAKPNVYEFYVDKTFMTLNNYAKNINDSFVRNIVVKNQPDGKTAKVSISVKNGVVLYENPNSVNEEMHEIIMKIPSSVTDYTGDKMTIVVDPGHGGKDAGARRTSHNIREIDIIEMTTPFLKEELEKLGYRVLLTRDSNKFISLYSRVRYAEFVRGDLLVSLHVNSLPTNHKAKGVEVFANKSNPAKTETIKLASSIMNSLTMATNGTRKIVKDYNLFITREARLTSTLVEMGFLTNDNDLAQMLTQNHRKLIAKAIATGVDNYIKNNKSVVDSYHNKPYNVVYPTSKPSTVEGSSETNTEASNTNTTSTNNDDNKNSVNKTSTDTSYDEGLNEIINNNPDSKINVSLEEVGKKAEGAKVNRLNDLVKPQLIIALINKTHRLPSTYEPNDLIYPDTPSRVGVESNARLRKSAAKALDAMCNKAKSEKGYQYYNISGYRSYAYQKSIYENSILKRGVEQTKKLVAYPGESEHQSGLAVSLSIDDDSYRFEKSFGSTPEGKWLAANCYKYGFIMRYPADKEAVTGYSYQPWHLRYVGKKLAKTLHDKNLCLEEYYK